MLAKDRLVMDSEDRKRLFVVGQAIDKKITQKRAAEILELTERQIRRIVRTVGKEGDKRILHGGRGKCSNNRIAIKLKEEVLALCRSRYRGFGPTLAAEKLMEEKEIRISDETIRKWLLEEGIAYKRRRDRPHRQWRERKECFGEMVQMDGSHHDWLEGRGPKLVLMAYIDDATNYVYARFYDHEGTIPAFDGLKRYIRLRGIPCSIYLDKHTTYKSTKKLSVEEQLRGLEQPQSQFERAMQELGVQLIHANSAPAKGRIERLFRTFQDRLIKEMRLQEICTEQQANHFLRRYLPIHNSRFRKTAARKVDMHRPVGRHLNLDSVFSIKTERFLRNDFTVAHNGKLYQVHNRLNTRTVIAEERLDGAICLSHGGKFLRFSELPKQPKEVPQDEERPISRRGRARKPPTPGINHPWKKFQIKKPKLLNRTF